MPKTRTGTIHEAGGIGAFLLICFGIIAVAAAIGGASSSSTGSSGSSDKSSLACDHFRNVASDAAGGLLTPSELRSKLKQVYDNSAIATPAVEGAARQMLAAATAADYDTLSTAVTAMGSACTMAGH